VHSQTNIFEFFDFNFQRTNKSSDLMLSERTKAERAARLPSVQSLTDKMSRLTNRKAHNNPKLLLNELTGDRNVTFSNNHSTAKATSSEGKE
jgi:hypothetical protein